MQYLVIVLLVTLTSCNRNKTSGDLVNGVKAPELKLPDLEGNEVALSSLRGKLVLIDFWAAWCKPCRRQNPRLVEVYKKYQGKEFKNAEGFEIYSVSLDSEKANWVAAIKKDDLVWPYHVGDLKGWRSVAVAIYKVQAIPTSVLVDANGIIIGKDLEPRNLDKLLATRLK